MAALRVAVFFAVREKPDGRAFFAPLLPSSARVILAGSYNKIERTS